MVVMVGASTLAFDADSVEGLLTVEVAGSAGVVVVQDVAYQRVDLAGRLALRALEDGSDTRVVLLSHGGVHGIVRVDRVRGLREVEPLRVVPLPQQFRGEEQNWYRGLLVLNGAVALLLNTLWVLEQTEAGPGEFRLGRYGRGPRVINVSPELVMGKVQEC
jgi:chemotaxis protein histidine kinase CheA